MYWTATQLELDAAGRRSSQSARHGHTVNIHAHGELVYNSSPPLVNTLYI